MMIFLAQILPVTIVRFPRNDMTTQTRLGAVESETDTPAKRQVLFAPHKFSRSHPAGNQRRHLPISVTAARQSILCRRIYL
ncbi:MAG: hypothetical protein U0X75_25550 [Acidobacteriota bacterium]